MIVGAYRDDDLNTNSGSFYLLYLNDDGTVQSSVKVSNTNGGLSNQISDNALFGESIDGVNDIDGDGISEILVGALGHINPTLAQNTGAFYMIELNSDGTVSEDLLYTYGEYCFSGELFNGDYFGGAITLMESGANPKIAVSAYHDSENGPERGAVWILDLGEKTYSITEAIEPTCGMDDGSFTVSGLIPNLDYTITYDYNGATINDYYLSDLNGTFEVVNLSAGTYNDIVVTESLINCSNELGSLTLNGVAINPLINLIEPTSCGATDGEIEMGNLIANSDYLVSYILNGLNTTVVLSTDSNGELTVSGLMAGIYMDFEVIDVLNSCGSTPTQLTINDIGLNIQSQVTNPSECGIDNGMITIAEVQPNSSYNISFQIGSTLFNQDYISNTNGEIFVQNLSSGAYEFFRVLDSFSGCMANLGTIEIDEPELEMTSSFINPSACGVSDGLISFLDLQINSMYKVSYRYNGIPESINITSDDSGYFELKTLEGGVYSNITVTDLFNGCQTNIEDIILTAPSFSPQVYANSPTSCTSENGSISISGLLPNTVYEVSFDRNSNQTVLNLTSDSMGGLFIETLNLGSYENFSISSQNHQCSIVLPSIELSCNGELIGCFVAKKFFTPNGDGFNDQWNLDTIDNCSYIVQIFDRYGKLLTTLTPNDPYWDGTYNGKLMPSSDYWYSVQYFEESASKIFQSHFSLKR